MGNKGAHSRIWRLSRRGLKRKLPANKQNDSVGLTMPSDMDRSYFFPSCGPWGTTIDDQLRTESRLNASWSQQAWESAKLDGCLPRPGRPLPRWPPPAGTGFIYPSSEKAAQTVLDLGVARQCPEIYAEEPPFVECRKTRKRIGPVLDTVNPNECPPSGAKARTCPETAAKIAAKILNLVPGVGQSVTVPYPNISQGYPVQPQYSMPNQPYPSAAQIQSLEVPNQPYPSAAQIQSFAPQQEPQGFPQQAYEQLNLFTPSPSPGPAPSPGPYDKPQCILDNPEFSVGEVFPCTVNTVRGIVYDFQHWKDIPRDSAGSKLSYVFGRDDRAFYLVIIIVLILLLILILKMLLGGGKKKQHTASTQYIPVPYYQVPASVASR